MGNSEVMQLWRSRLSSFVVACAFIVAGCGDAATESSANLVCFEFEPGHQVEVGQFESQFFPINERVKGMTGNFQLTIGNESYFSLELESGVDPVEWIRALPSDIAGDPVVSKIAASGGGCPD